MNNEDFKELLTEHGLKLSKTGTLTTEIDTRLDDFLLDLKSQLEIYNVKNDKMEIVNKHYYQTKPKVRVSHYKRK